MRPGIGGAAAVALGLALCACSNSGLPASSPTAPTTSPPAASSASPTPEAPSPNPSAALARCTTAHLAGSLINGEGAAGSIIYSLEFQNVGPSSCTLFGNPGVSLVTGSAMVQLGAAATFVNQSTATTVTLAPNSRAGAVLQIAEAQNFPVNSCDPAPALGLRVYPPGETAALFVPASGLVGCRNPGAQLLQVGPVTG